MEDDYCLRFKGYSESMAVAAKSFAAMAEVPGQDPTDGGEMILPRPAAELFDMMDGVNENLINQAIRELTIYDKHGKVGTTTGT